MKEDTRWKLTIATILVTLSLTLYTVNFLIFHNAQNVLLLMLNGLAFLPIEVLVVTIIIDQLLAARDLQQKMEKLNMVIGIFFSHLGTPLLSTLAQGDPESAKLSERLGSKSTLESHRSILLAYKSGNPPPLGIDRERIDLVALKEFLNGQEDFLVRLVENPMVFEHESFTDLILAVDHLSQELKARPGFSELPPSDEAHLTGDIRRVYALLVPEWIKYMDYLRTHYPYLHSLALRTNPFDTTTSAIVQQ